MKSGIQNQAAQGIAGTEPHTSGWQVVRRLLGERRPGDWAAFTCAVLFGHLRLRLAALLLISPYLVYFVAANGYLAVRQQAHLELESGGSLRLEWQRAWSFWPNRLHVRGLFVQGEVAHTDVSLRFDSIALAIEPGQWLGNGARSELTFPELVGKGVEIVSARREQSRPSTGATIERLHFARIDLDEIRLVEVLGRRFEGIHRAVGAVTVRFGMDGSATSQTEDQLIQVESDVALSSERLLVDGTVWAEDVSLEWQGVAKDLSSGPIHVDRVLESLDGRGEFHAQLANLDRLELLLPAAAEFQLESGASEASASFHFSHLDDGTCSDEGEFRLEPTFTEATISGRRVSTKLGLSLPLARICEEGGAFTGLDLADTVLELASVRDEDDRFARTFDVKVQLHEGRTMSGEAVVLDAHAVFEVSDSRPLVQWLAGDERRLRRASRLLRPGSLTGRASLRSEGGVIAIDSLGAHGDGVSFEGSFCFGDGADRGVMLASVRSVPIASWFDGEESHTRPIRPRAAYGKQLERFSCQA